MDCKFCNMSLNKFDRIVQSRTYSPTIYLDIDKNGDYVLIASADDETTIKVNNCPVCGRRLKFVNNF